MEINFDPQSLSLANCDVKELTTIGGNLGSWQRGLYWWLGDLVIYAKARFPDTWHQCLPESISPDMISRCEAVSRAYKPEQRHSQMTWTSHMICANHEWRLELLELGVEMGCTSDGFRALVTRVNGLRNGGMDLSQVRAQLGLAEKNEVGAGWMLAVDCNYWLHKYWHSGAGVEAASRVHEWILRTIERLQKQGLTDAVCCFDVARNFRKELSPDYKDRPKKEAELKDQISVLQDLLTSSEVVCVGVDGFEADDCLATYAKRFRGHVTLLAADKDFRQCLEPGRVNMLRGWDEEAGTWDYVTVEKHASEHGLRPDQWIGMQMLMGDAVDNVAGAKGIGEKRAKDILHVFGSPESAVEAAKENDPRFGEMRGGQMIRESLVEFSERLSLTRKLVELRTDVPLPEFDTRLT